MDVYIAMFFSVTKAFRSLGNIMERQQLFLIVIDTSIYIEPAHKNELMCKACV